MDTVEKVRVIIGSGPAEYTAQFTLPGRIKTFDVYGYNLEAS